MRTAWTAAVVVALASVSAPAHAQSLVDAAKRAEDSRKASTAPPLIFDRRDIDPRFAAHEVLGYELTEARWKKFMAADRLVNAIIANDLALRQRFEALRTTSPRVLERFLTREPSLTKALEASGTTPHDHAYTAVAAAVAVAIIVGEPPPTVYEQLPDTTKANVTFVRAHMDEMKEMFAQVQQRMGAGAQ